MTYEEMNKVIDRELAKSALALMYVVVGIVSAPFFLAVWLLGLPCRLVLWMAKEWRS